MTRDDLTELPLDELWVLHEQICDVLSTRINAEKLELEKRLAQLNRQQTDRKAVAPSTSGTHSTRKKYPRVLPKYKNPAAPEETWSGRGKQPRWLVTALLRGGNIDDFKIVPEGKAGTFR